MMQKSVRFVHLVVVMAIFFVFGCTSNQKPSEENTKKEEPKNEPVKRTLVTDPAGVVMTVNGLPVTKGELDSEVENQIPQEKVKLYFAFMTYFVPQIVTKSDFSEKEKKQLLDEVKGIMAKVKSGEMKFEDAITKNSDYNGLDKNKGHFTDTGPSQYLAFDKVLSSTPEGQYSEPFLTPDGVNVIKVVKINKDFNQKPISYDYDKLEITFNKFIKDGKKIDQKINEEISTAKVEILDSALEKILPEQVKFLGMKPEEIQKVQEAEKNKPEPDHTWADVKPETVVAKINGTPVTKKELTDVVDGLTLPVREFYNQVINKYFIPTLTMTSYYAKDKDAIFKKLNDIKAEIESGKTTFKDAQQKNSDDPGKSQNDGVYKNLSKGEIPDFDKIMWTIPVGKISEPFLTQYGGHILLVEKETLGKDGKRVKADVRHILISFGNYAKKEAPKEGEQPKEPTPQELMMSAYNEANKDVKVAVLDEYLHSLLPKLGEPPKSPESEANGAGTTDNENAEATDAEDEQGDTDATPGDTPESEKTEGNQENPSEGNAGK